MRARRRRRAIDAGINIDHNELEAFCARWQITELALFGSALREDFGPESDIDLLVSFAPEARWGLFDLVHMERTLEEMTGRDVDLITSGPHNETRRRAKP